GDRRGEAALGAIGAAAATPAGTRGQLLPQRAAVERRAGGAEDHHGRAGLVGCGEDRVAAGGGQLCGDRAGESGGGGARGDDGARAGKLRGDLRREPAARGGQIRGRRFGFAAELVDRRGHVSRRARELRGELAQDVVAREQLGARTAPGGERHAGHAFVA